MNNIKPLNSWVSNISNEFKVISAKVIDWNSVIRNAFPCRSCGTIWFEKDMEAYHNYGWVKKKTYWCDECFEEAQYFCWQRVSRNKNEVHSYTCTFRRKRK